ncbi:MAG: polysaccharide biosynthesis protein [Bacteroidetes bacterium]|nr:MAG: polysaccharide biosynthesis protein [Bacteroidota bacterium]
MSGSSRIKKLASETAIYGVSSIFGRLINFLLFPFYSHQFAPEVFATVGVIYAAFVFLNILYQYGMESAYLKFSADSDSEREKRITFSTALGALAGTGILFSAVLVLFHDDLGALLLLDTDGSQLLVLAAGILLIDTVNIVPYAELRLQNKAWRFAFVRTAGIVTNVVLNLVLILQMDFGIEAIFIANFAASIVSLLLLLPTIWQKYQWIFNRKLAGELLRFGLPFVPAGLGYALSQNVNIFFLKYMPADSVLRLYGENEVVRKLADTAAAGSVSVYADFIAGAYIGIIKLAIIMALVIQMFRYAWQPFFLQHAKDPDAKELFARVFTYLTGALLTVFLAVSFFADDLVAIPLPGGRTLIDPAYWIGLSIIPIALVGFIFQGWYYAFSAGVYIEKKTKYFVVCTLAGSVVALVTNWIFVPQYGMAAAAWSMSSSYAVMAILLFVIVQRFYPIHYQWNRIAIMIAGAAAIFFTWYIQPSTHTIWIEGALVGVFTGLVFFSTRFR